MMIYKRQMFKDQWNYLEKKVLEKSRLEFIVGSPGCGKSTSAYSFLLDLNNKNTWIITWIHLMYLNNLIMVQKLLGL